MDEDYNKIFSQVVNHISIKVILALIAMYDLEFEQLDVKIVFLHRDLEEQISCINPKGLMNMTRSIWCAN